MLEKSKITLKGSLSHQKNQSIRLSLREVESQVSRIERSQRAKNSQLSSTTLKLKKGILLQMAFLLMKIAMMIKINLKPPPPHQIRLLRNQMLPQIQTLNSTNKKTNCSHLSIMISMISMKSSQFLTISLETCKSLQMITRIVTHTVTSRPCRKLRML